MKRLRLLTGVIALSLAAVLPVPAPSAAAGPEIGKTGVPSPLGAAPAKGGVPAPGSSQKALAPPSTGAPAATAAEPKWPQSFELGAGERTRFGFVAGQPGPIVVTVKWQGAPLVLTLGKPGGGTVVQQGSGAATLRYAATADDVKKGVLWWIGIRPAQEAAKPSSGPAGSKPVRSRYQVAAKGTVDVRHPPGDMARAQGELNTLAAKAKAEQSKPVPAAPPQADALAQARAGLQKQQAARQAQMLEQIRQKIPAEAYQKMSKKIASPSTPPAATSFGGTPTLMTATAAKPAGVGSSAVEGGGTSSTVSKSFGSAKGPKTAFEPGGMTIGAVVPGVSSTQSGQVGAAGSNPIQSVAAAPAIASLSVTQGMPGDPVSISGSGFGGTPGEVHFIVANQRDLVAPVTYWSGNQILTEVPYADGVPSYPGSMYVKHVDGAKTGLHSFRFNPVTDLVTLEITPDRMIKAPYDYRYLPAIVWHGGAGDLFGARGDDEFFLSTRLQNGWVVDGVYLTMTASDTTTIHISGNANAYITESREGTNSPYIKVHWWRDGLSTVAYAPRVVIRGPKRVPWQ